MSIMGLRVNSYNCFAICFICMFEIIFFQAYIPIHESKLIIKVPGTVYTLFNLLTTSVFFLQRLSVRLAPVL